MKSVELVWTDLGRQTMAALRNEDRRAYRYERAKSLLEETGADFVVEDGYEVCMGCGSLIDDPEDCWFCGMGVK